MLSPSLLSTVFYQIESLVYFRNKKNHKTNQSEIGQIIKLHTSEAERHFIRCLFSSLDCSNEIKSNKDIYQAQYLCQELVKLFSKPNFVSIVCYAVDNPLPIYKNNGSSTKLFSQITQVSSLSRLHEVILGLSLTQSNDAQLSAQAKQWVQQKLPELVAAYLATHDAHLTNENSLKCLPSNTELQTTNTSKSAQETLNPGNLHDINADLLHFVLSHLCEDAEHYGLSDAVVINFIDALRKEYPRSRLSLVLNTLLYSDIIGQTCVKVYQSELNLASPSRVVSQICLDSKSNSSLSGSTTTSISPQSSICSYGLSSNNPYLIADLLEELGYECTKTLESLRSVLCDFDVDELNPTAIAKCLCLFLRTADGQLNSHHIHSNDNNQNITIYNKTMFSDEQHDSQGNIHLDDSNITSSLSTWNTENFFAILLELNPNLRLTTILNELDCSEFMITSRQSFDLFKQIIFYDNQSHLSSADYFYHSWVNSLGQFSLLQYCSMYPDVICLVYWPYRCVDISMLHVSLNEDEQASIQLWKNIDYVQALLNISEKGLYADVYQLFKRAFLLYPDILTATLLETHFSTLRNIMLGHAIVYFLTTRLNSQVLLQSAWNGGKSNLLTSTELQHQRQLFIASCIEYTGQLMSNGSLEPSTLHPRVSDSQHRNVLNNNNNASANFCQFIELLVSITDSSTRGCAVLPILLGTTESLSTAVSDLLRPTTTLNVSGSTSNLLDSVNSSTSATGLPIHLLLPPSQAIDLTLVLVICMANAISSNTTASTAAGGSRITGPSETSAASLASIQTAIKSFLSQWFMERFHDKLTADPFAIGVVDYLRVHYTSHVAISSTFIPRDKLAFPTELRKPSLSLLTHIIQSTQAALRSGSCLVSRPILIEVHQSLNTLLQLVINSALNRTSSQSTLSSNSGSAMKSNATGSSQSQLLTTRASSSAASVNSLRFPTTNLPTISSLSTNKFVSNVDTNTGVSRNITTANTLNSNKLNPGGMQHVTNPLTLQLAARRKAQASGMVGPSMTTDSHMQALNSNFSISIPMEHPPLELSFVNEPIKIQLSKEAEAEANTFFQKLLEGINPPDDMFKTLYDFATQGTPSQRKLLDGILRMLADEVSRHLQDYPETMLPLFADLYGSVLAASTHLFSMRALSMLWRSVLARLFTLPPETHMDSTLFRAMIHILMKAKNTFVHFSNLPNCLASCPVFKVFPHDLQGYILNSEIAIKNYSLAQQTTPLSKNLTTTASINSSSNQLVAATHFQLTESLPQSTGLNLTVSTSNAIGNAGDAYIKAPDAPEESISDRVYFLFNNVSKVNAKEKSSELATLLAEDRLIPWFAFYLVSKRIPVEQTFHDLFALVLDHIQERVPNVRPKVMYELIRHIKFILSNMRLDKDDMQARSTLKNFGSFLGLITLARNKPVLHDDLNIKDLIYEAYYKGPIPTQYVVPFVARVVRGATESLVFRPPNPWTMAILKVLRELYDMDNVKDWLRFEIEILYRAFELNLNDIPSANFLRDPTHSSNLDIELCFIATTTTTTTASSATSMTTTNIAGGQIVVSSNTSAITSIDSSLYPGICSSLIPDYSVTTVAGTTTTFSSGATTSSNLPSQQQKQMSNMFSMLHKQQQVSSTESVPTQQTVYSTHGLDLTNLVQNSTGSNCSNPNRQSAAALAAAVAAIKKQQQQFGPSGTCPSSALSLQQHQQQLSAAMAAFQHTQQQPPLQLSHQPQTPQSVLPSHNNPISQSTVTQPNNSIGGGLSGDLSSGSLFPGHLLRYEDVNIRSIRACLNLDELLANAAINSRNGGTNTAGITAAFALLQANPRLRGLIEPAVLRAINELTIPVFERCARITVTTVVAIVRKDFALDPDPARLLYAACQMIRHLAAGMSLITAREALGMSLVTSLKNIILTEVQSATGQEKEAVQQLAYLVVGKSMHVCLAYMQKSVAEKAVKDVEKKLEADIKLRTELGPIRFMEQAVSQLTSQQSNMPESLRLTAGGLTATEMSVYEEFGRVIPGFAPNTSGTMMNTPSSSLLLPATLNSLTAGQNMSPSTMNSAASMAAYLQLSASQKQQFSSAGILQRQTTPAIGTSTSSLIKPQIYPNPTNQPSVTYQAPLAGLFDKIIGQIERHLVAISGRLRPANDPMCQSLRCLIDAVHLAKTSRDTSIANNIITVMVQSFLEHYRPSFWRDQPRGLETMEHLKEAHMLTLRHMLSLEQTPFGYAWVTRQVTHTWIHLDGGNASCSQSSISFSNTGNTSTTDNLQNRESDLSTSTDKTSLDMVDTLGNTWAASGWKQFTENGGTNIVHDNRLVSVKWNWEAFAEFLRVHVIYFSQVDAYLAQEVAKGHPGAITFVIDLLDHFVLPSPTGTSLGAAAAAAANYARANSSTILSQPGASAVVGGAGNPGSSSVNVSVSGANVNYPIIDGSSSAISSTKREFTVLNEYDLWSTLEALRNRVSFLNNSLSTPSLTDPLSLRLRLACARVRGLLDLGLMEQSPLFCNPSCTIGALYAGCSQAHEFDDPPNLQEKVELIMRNWVEIYQSPKQRDPATIDALLSQLTQIGVLPSINNSTRFLRLATIFVIERALKQLKLEEQQQQQPQVPNGASGGSNFSSNPAINRVAAYVELDAYARLVSILINQLGETPQGEYPNAKVALLNKVLGLIAGTLLQEHEVRRDLFHPMPFERLLVILFVELQSPLSISSAAQFNVGASPRSDAIPDEGCIDKVNPDMHRNTELDKACTGKQGDSSGGNESRTPNISMKSLGPLTLQQQLPLIFCHLLHCLRPEKATAFVFSWLEMLAHRWFVGRILSAPGLPKLRAAYQAMYAQLLADLLKFLGYFLQNALMPKSIQCLYKATLRLLLVLIHDFPEFVSDYYALFCDVVPSNSIQMRNIILSALPKRGIPSADPLQAPPVDQLASLEDPTGYCMEAGSRLPEPMRCELDAYLTTRAPVKLLSELVTMLRRADDIISPIPPPQFAYHSQQQVRHQQALAAYAVALAANDVGLGSMKNEDKPNSEDQFLSSSSTPTQAVNKTSGKSGTTESWEGSRNTSSTAAAAATTSDNTNETSSTSNTTSRTTLNLPNSVVSGGSSTALAALLWGVRATQQLATFGLADSMHYNIELMTNLTLYVCITAIRNLREKGMPLNMSTIAHTPQMDIIQSLVLNLDNEGRYLLLNCMANQLRYPNSHTYYFSYTILYLFSEQSKEQVKEQISRVLMERLIVNRPHPWGLLMTSAELLRNPAYRFWEHEFARCNPEIEAIVTIVARSCIPNFQIPNVNSSETSTTSGVSSSLRYALLSSGSGQGSM
ncbi:CCR4-NOT transcription complex subunit 1 [Schistosoma japonicum]|uniref:CCR4-NOT transcription complex subunit 1 n=2 Tax=Schistosoma japonicum TaxID=6182 RepID=A0A4Z2CN99_SCHJA|nr:CCR4-NOT transcription complex subunit 1 [Schistosoma japonicum]